jgi:glycosyltransferase involved in cell wall biosynthesis
MTASPRVSICIPAYNRPEDLERLLKSIDADKGDVEIVICEDKSPKRHEIKTVVKDFEARSKYLIHLYLNESNFGYDKNIRELVQRASGKFIVFMGDDDEFVPGALDKLIGFLKNNQELGYVLKSHRFYFEDGKVEPFRYYEETKFFPAGFRTYTELFRKSVFISGFTINREHAKQYFTEEFDGSLLMQLYLLAEVTLKHPSAYFDEPLTQAYEGGTPFFGNSDAERDLYTPGTITIENSLNFLQGFFKITKFIDKNYEFDSTTPIKKDMSKYSYPSLAIQRDSGLGNFLNYVKRMKKIGFRGFYFNIYVIGLSLFGKKQCDTIIVFLKNSLGSTPRL